MPAKTTLLVKKAVTKKLAIVVRTFRGIV